MKILRRLRILLASGVLLGFTALFVDPTGIVRAHVAWLARWQLVPACLAGSILILLAVVGLTLLGGRIYCSVICPLGILQDVIIGFRRMVVRRGFPVAATRPLTWVRACVAVMFTAGGFLGAHFIWLEPYAIYGRLMSITAGLLGTYANNRLAAWAEAHGSYVAVQMEILLPPLAIMGFALALGGLVLVLAAWKGRWWCNTICPVGTVLGWLARWAWLKPRLETARCVQCGACARRCKARCIDVATGKIDASRCVMCLDCATVCPQEAVRWK